MQEKHPTYNPLHCRSFYSLLQGTRSPRELCEYAAAKGHSHIGMTDINNFYGLIHFLKAAEEYNLKPVCGTAVSVGGRPLFTAYCKDLNGFTRINEVLSRLLSSQPFLRGSGRESSVGAPQEDAWSLPEGTSMEHARSFRGDSRYDPARSFSPRSKIPSGSLNPYENGGKEYLPVEDLLENGWEGLWIVSAATDVLSRLMRRQKDGLVAALFYGRPFAATVRWAKTMDIPVIALNEGVYLSEEDRRLYTLLRAIDKNTTIGTLGPEDRIEKHQQLVTGEEMVRFFSAVPEALHQAEKIARESSCKGILRNPYVFPRYEGLSEQEACKRLRALCYKGIDRRYGSISKKVEQRLQYELSIVRRKGFANYFLVVRDIVRMCPRTCGRGSSAASIISYLLGITHVDPLEHNLFFERFLNMGRKDPPDIDVDFPWDERDKALAYVFKTYWRHAGMVADHVTFGPRSSLREPAKAMGLEEAEIGTLVKLKLAGETARIPRYLLRASARIRGIPRHLGLHPGGVVITPEEITRYTHLQTSRNGLPVIAWEKDGTEDAGLVKIDLLGNRSLAVLRDTIRLVNSIRPAKLRTPLRWESFNPLHDGKTRELIERGQTLGVFYIESPATRQLLKKMKRGDFEHLIIASSIIRPAANRYIRQYVERLHGGDYDSLHPLVEKTLKETEGIMVYQEDVARVAIAIAGFSASEADMLRKILSKKDRETCLMSYRDRFYNGGRNRGVGEEVLHTLWEMILSFDGYSFCKAHSASYALVSYRLAWLKRYFPLQFMVSVINNGGGFYHRQVYLNEVRRMGVVIRGPDVNKSLWKNSVEDGAMRTGLSQIRELPEPFVKNILKERESNGAFIDVFDFLRRTSPGFLSLRMLVRSGSLDSIAGGYTRPEMLWAFYHMDRGPCLFDTPVMPTCIGDYSPRRKIFDELTTLGILFSRHPLTVFSPVIKTMLSSNNLPPCIDSRAIASRTGSRVCIPGTLVTGKEVRTKNREYMSFLSFEDTYGVYETVLFPKEYQKHMLLLEWGGAFLVVGTVQEEFDTHTIEIERLLPVEQKRD